MFYEQTAVGFILRIRVTPNASKSSIGGIFTDADGKDFLKININAVPEKGKANQELIKILSKTLGISKSSFTIISGETDRYKKVSVPNASPSIKQALEQLEKNV